MPKKTIKIVAQVTAFADKITEVHTIVNDGGTLLCTRKLDAILGSRTDNQGKHLVRVQAGCRLKKLNLWLQQQGWEIPFQAEIGEAIVGSIAVEDTKESSLDGSGYFSSHVVAILSIDENGSLRVLSDKQNAADFYEFKSSFGLSGIVVECVIEVREDCDALLVVVILHQLVCFVEQRYRAGASSVIPIRPQPEYEQNCTAKRLGIQRGFDGGSLPQPKGIVFSRHEFINEYWRPGEAESRLDFQYYEHDIGRPKQVIA